MISGTLFRWLVSQSIFLARINVFDMYGVEQPTELINACEYSGMALVYVISLGAVMMITVWSASFRKLNPTLLMALSCSAAVMVACHPLPDKIGAAPLPLKYGIVKIWGRTRCASFGSSEVDPLVDKSRCDEDI